MHIAFAANGRRVAEPARHFFDGGAEIALCLGGAVEALKLIERHRREDRSRPGAEVLRGDFLAGDFLEILVHVSRCDILAISGFVHVLQQFLSGQILARFYYLGDAPVPDPQRPLLAALAGKAEAHLVSVDGDMAVLESGEAVAVVLFGVVVIAYADQRGFQKMYDGRQHLFARQSAQAHMLLYFLPDRGQRISKSDDVFIFGALSHLAKKRVIAILFASLRVASRRLNVTIGKRAYPDIRPRRRDCQSLDPLQHVRFGQLRSVRTRVDKTGPGLFAAYSRPSIRNISQPGKLGGVPRVNNGLDAIRRIEQQGSRPFRFRAKATVPG